MLQWIDAEKKASNRLSINDQLIIHQKENTKIMVESFPELNSDRIKLRKSGASDIPALIKYCHNPKIADQIINIPYPYTEEDAINRISFVNLGFKNKERFVFAITIKPDNELIGEIGLHLDKPNNSAQFGYWVAESHWGKGIATEAAMLVLKFGFESLNLNKIIATHFSENIASGVVMKKNKMIKEAEMKEHYKIDNEYRTVIQYRLIRSEYDDMDLKQEGN